MRILAIFLALLPAQVWACSCLDPGSPSNAAGRSAAVFAGTVLSVTDLAPVPIAQEAANRVTALSRPVLVWEKRVARLRVRESLSGVLPLAEVEVVTGMGGGDCGVRFETGKEFFVYADRNPEGKFRTDTCSRTRPLAQATEDIAYLRATAGAPQTGRLIVHTGYPGFPAKPGLHIAAEAAGVRIFGLTNTAGDAVFENLPPGEYRVHSVADGDLPDDPKFQLGAKGSQDVTLIRTLKVRGRITTSQGQPVTRADIELRSTAGERWEEAAIGHDGKFEILLGRPGRYYLGVHLNTPVTADSPYPRWFHPGTADEAAATVIEFSGTPDVRTFDLTLPDPKPVRTVEGDAFLSDVSTRARHIQLFAVDIQGRLVTQTVADPNGRFRLSLPADGSYQIHAVSAGNGAEAAVSAEPIGIEAGLTTMTLRIALSQSGNSYLDVLSGIAKTTP